MDFGLTRRAAPDEAELTQSGVILGTVAYMPPEQAAGRLELVGPVSDVYSLGVVLYHLLAGRRPFSGMANQILGQILHVEPPLLSLHRREIDPQLEAICLKAMAKPAEERYQSMTDFARALSGWLKRHRGG
jgi:serine/threonine-protein kinase